MPYSFHYLIMSEHSMFQKELLMKLKGSGLTIGQPKVLDYLKDHNGASQKDIALGCHIEPGTLTTLLNRMEETGLVERRMLNGNRRSFYIFLTEMGERKLELVSAAFKELFFVIAGGTLLFFVGLARDDSVVCDSVGGIEVPQA